MRASTVNAACSQRIAISAAPLASMAHGWNRSRSFSAALAVARSRLSGKPAAGSLAVKRAMSCAARTVCSRAAGENSEVLAWPRRCPANTDTLIDLSRLRSTFSRSPLRTDTDSPTPSDTSALASLAPIFWATRSASSTSCWKSARE